MDEIILPSPITIKPLRAAPRGQEMPIAEALKRIQSRQLDGATAVYAPQHARPKTAAALAGDAVEGPPSIVELARALKNDPDLIFEWVYNNIEFHPTFGEAKGALGCLIDGIGNNFDQCELLFALFTQAGFSPAYVFGSILLTPAQLGAWLGTDPTDATYSADVLLNGGFPWEYVGDDIQLSYLWIQVELSGTTYVFDPSFKTYTSTTPIDLATAMGYSQSTFISNAEVGATIDPSGNFVENINRTNLRSDLTTYATNLQTWIETNNPAARTGNIVGGRTINQITAPVRLISLPYETPGDTPAIWSSIPDEYRTTLRIQWASLDITLFGSDVHGQRLTIFQNSSNHLQLALNGDVLGTEVTIEFQYTLTHPYASTFADTSWLYFYDDNYTTGYEYRYLEGVCLGPMSQGTIDYYEAMLAQAQAAGGAALSEPVLGINLALMFYTRCVQDFATASLQAGINSGVLQYHQNVGAAYFLSLPPSGPTGHAGFDLTTNVLFNLPTSATSTANNAFLASGLFANGYEMLTIQQITGTGAVATPRIIDVANSDGTALYKITHANQSTLLPMLSGYTSRQMELIEEYLSSTTAAILIPQSQPQVSGDLNGGGWLLFPPGTFGGVIALGEVTHGGFGTTPCLPWKGMPKKKCDCDCEEADPVDTRTGDYRYESSDISVGSTRFPYQLEFKSMYDSRLSLVNGPMGLGWRHNWIATANAGNDFLRNLGSESPIEAAMTIAALYLAADICADGTFPVDKVAILELATDWWIDQLTNNSATISLPEGDYVFVKLADGSYSPQINDVSALSLSGGLFVHTTPQQVVRNFNSDGNLATMVFPYGVTITLGYTSGMLTSISNGVGRQLTLSYTGAYLSLAADGNGRSSQYVVNTVTDLLTSITDPMTFATTFSYDSSNRFLSYF